MGAPLSLWWRRTRSLYLLGWSLWAHLFGRVWARLRKRERPGLAAFREAYRADGIWHVPALERVQIATLGECTACGICDTVCPVLRVSAVAALPSEAARETGASSAERAAVGTGGAGGSGVAIATSRAPEPLPQTLVASTPAPAATPVSAAVPPAGDARASGPTLGAASGDGAVPPSEIALSDAPPPDPTARAEEGAWGVRPLGAARTPRGPEEPGSPEPTIPSPVVAMASSVVAPATRPAPDPAKPVASPSEPPPSAPVTATGGPASVSGPVSAGIPAPAGSPAPAGGVASADGPAAAIAPTIPPSIAGAPLASRPPSSPPGPLPTFAGPLRLVTSSSRLLPSVDAWGDAFACIRCGVCDVACPQGVAIDALVGALRRRIAADAPSLVPEGVATSIASARASGHLRGAPPAAPGREEGRMHDVAYVASCAASEADVRTDLALLAKAGCDAGAAPAICCGAHEACAMGRGWAGNGPGSPASAQGVVGAAGSVHAPGGPSPAPESPLRAAIARGRALHVAVADPRCLAHLRADPAFADLDLRAVVDMAPDLAALPTVAPPGDPAATAPPESITVTLHDPCALARAPGGAPHLRDAVRRAGCALAEMPRHGRDAPCCGMGGGGGEAHPALAQAIGRERVREAAATGAAVLVVDGARCRDHLARCAALEGSTLAILTPAELLAERCGAVGARRAEEAARTQRLARERAQREAAEREAQAKALAKAARTSKGAIAVATPAADAPSAASSVAPPPDAEAPDARRPSPSSGDKPAADPAKPKGWSGRFWPLRRG